MTRRRHRPDGPAADAVRLAVVAFAPPTNEAETMSHDVAWDHPAHETYRDLFETLALATRFLQSPGNMVDAELAERLESACSDAIRYVATEHCEMPPEWLAALAEFFTSVRTSVRVTTTIVSDAVH